MTTQHSVRTTPQRAVRLISRVAAVACAFLCASGAVAGGECAPAWVPFGGTGMNQVVRALAVFDDGSGGGPALYAGGQFTTSGGMQTKGIAKWNGVSWAPFGTGVGGDGPLLGVRALAVFDDGSGPALYAGGQFTTIDGVAAEGIARWRGGAWSSVGSGQLGPANSIVTSLAVYDDGQGGGPALHAGGSFTTIGGVSALRIAKWNGSAWSAVGGGVSSGVHALVVLHAGGSPVLIASGIFASAGGTPAIYVARWNGLAWSALDNSLAGLGVYSLAVHDDGLGGGPTLFVGGEFNVSGPAPLSRIARWTGTAWAPVGGGVNGGVYSMASFDDGMGGGPALYAGGFFTTAGGVPAQGIARWNGTSWSPLGAGLDSGAFVMKEFADGMGASPALFVGGAFFQAGGSPAQCIAKWQGCLADACGPADLNSDGVVNGGDLGILLSAWGGGGAAADLDGDGTINGADLGALLAAWGPCS